MARDVGSKVAKRVSGLSEFHFVPFPRDPNLPIIPSLHATILIPGFLFSKEDLVQPFESTFSHVLNYQDIFTLAFETDILIELGAAFQSFMREQAIKLVSYEALKRTTLSTVTAAMSVPMAIAKLGDLIDNPWTLAVDRASKAGIILADVLIERAQGNRPVTLVLY